jgi:uncharacterized protein (TIGR00730 family)
MDAGENRTTLLSYENPEFIRGEAGRPLRILSEYLAPLQALRSAHVHDTIVFFGSARLREDGPLQRFYAEARQLASDITEWANRASPHRCCLVVCSGGGGGIMEAANRGAKEAGGRTVGFNIGLPLEQRPNAYLEEKLTFEFHYFFMRKFWFASLARAVIVFPGGFGTLDELFEMLTLRQTHKLEREFPILLYGSNYWREIINFDALVRHGMIAKKDLDMIEVVDSPAMALDTLQRQIRWGEEPVESPAIARSLHSCWPPVAT